MLTWWLPGCKVDVLLAICSHFNRVCLLCNLAQVIFKTFCYFYDIFSCFHCYLDIRSDSMLMSVFLALHKVKVTTC